MRGVLVFSSGMGSKPLGIFTMRQGLPLGSCTLTNEWLTASGYTPRDTSIATDVISGRPRSFSAAAATAGVFSASGNNPISGAVSPLGMPTNYVYCTAACRKLVVFGVGAPTCLFATDIATGYPVAIPVTGLGTVMSIAFSNDGSRMFVNHDASPYGRIYNTADWSYVNTSVLTNYPYTGYTYQKKPVFDRTGNYILVPNAGSSANGFDIVNATTGARTVSNTTSGYYLNSAVLHPTLNLFVCAMSVTSGVRVITINPVTGAIANIIPSTFAAFVLNLFIDPADQQVHLFHESGSVPTNYSTFFWSDPATITPQMGDVRTRFARTSMVNSLAVIPLVYDYGRITGTVRDIDNNPAPRDVLAINRASGEVVAKTRSAPVTGDYTLYTPDNSEHDLIFRAAPGELLNDLIYARVEPELIP